MKKYDIIYADPPWRYNFSKSNSRKIENKYESMSLNEICNLDIPSKDNSVLYLWATAPKLQEALKVMECWGFEYKTHLIWDKERIGMGYWFRGKHELLLVGVKGKFSPPSQKDRVSSVFRCRRDNVHSKKPFVVYKWIESWFPNCKYLEMFARKTSFGWDVWGDEVESDINIEKRDDE